MVMMQSAGRTRKTAGTGVSANAVGPGTTSVEVAATVEGVNSF